MSPELLKQIEARVKSSALRGDDAGPVAVDRRALLAYCRELEMAYNVNNALLEAALDWAIKDADCAEGLAFYNEVPPHLAPILEASRKRIQEQGTVMHE